MLADSRHWTWIACDKTGYLHLDLGPDVALCTPFKLRRLIKQDKTRAFSLAEAQFYEQVSDYLKTFQLWSDAKICQIAINATAAKFQLKPELAKSWFFHTYHGNHTNQSAVIELNAKSHSGLFLIIEHNQDSVLCLNLEDDIELDAGIHLKACDVIRVLNDRIHPWVHSRECALRA